MKISLCVLLFQLKPEALHQTTGYCSQNLTSTAMQLALQFASPNETGGQTDSRGGLWRIYAAGFGGILPAKLGLRVTLTFVQVIALRKAHLHPFLFDFRHSFQPSHPGMEFNCMFLDIASTLTFGVVFTRLSTLIILDSALSRSSKHTWLHPTAGQCTRPSSDFKAVSRVEIGSSCKR